VQFRKLNIRLLKKLNNEEIYGEKLLNKLIYRAGWIMRLNFKGCFCLALRGVHHDF